MMSDFKLEPWYITTIRELFRNRVVALQGIMFIVMQYCCHDVRQRGELFYAPPPKMPPSIE